MRRTVQRERVKAGNVPANLGALADIVLPEEYTRTLDGKNFLFYDSGADAEHFRMLVFATDDNLEILER